MPKFSLRNQGESSFNSLPFTDRWLFDKNLKSLNNTCINFSKLSSCQTFCIANYEAKCIHEYHPGILFFAGKHLIFGYHPFAKFSQIEENGVYFLIFFLFSYVTAKNVCRGSTDFGQ